MKKNRSKRYCMSCKFWLSAKKITVLLIGAFVVIFFEKAEAQGIKIGTATADITPALPVALMGQFHLRIAHKAETPLLANIIALEGDGEQAIFVACDLIVISDPVLISLRKEVSRRLPSFNVNKLIVTATHTHTSPVLDTILLNYPIPKQGVTQIDEYVDFFSKRVAEAIVKAWLSRVPGYMTWGLGHAVVGYNRRSVYANGTAAMYGATHVPEFRGIEGYEDHDVNTLFFWNKAGKLIGISVNVPCPAQEVEGLEVIHADFWHEARLAIKKKFGNDVCIVGWSGASGDQSPHVRYRSKADERMHRLANITRLQEIGRRIALAVEETYAIVKNDRHSDVPFIHKQEILQLPTRKVTQAEYTEAKTKRDELAAQIRTDPSRNGELHAQMYWYGGTVRLYEEQQKGERNTFPAEIHVLRLGDAVLCTNPFELYVDYSIRIQGRSKAVQTFVIQLSGAAIYLPTEKAVKGGGYSAIVQSTLVGPDGGHMLVDRTVSLIDELWDTEK